MKEKIYTIKNLCDELNQPRQKVREDLKSLKLKQLIKIQEFMKMNLWSMITKPF